jgi:hypothetical protein
MNVPGGSAMSRVPDNLDTTELGGEAPGSTNGHDRVAEHPQALPVLFENIPHDLRFKNQWVVWRYQRRKGKLTKPPFCARTGRAASSIDPTTWASFAEVRAAYEAGRWDGIGLTHLPEDRLTGLDWDHCRDPETSVIMDGPAQEIALMDTYAEVSPSGTGVRAYAFGKKPGRRCKAGPFEMYDGLTAKGERGGRFLTVTGHRLQGMPGINARQEQIDQLYHAHFGDVEKMPQADEAYEQESTPGLAASAPGNDAEDLHFEEFDQRPSKPDLATATDDELINHGLSVHPTFAILWKGDWQTVRNAHGTPRYPSQSEADLALMNLLACLTNKDKERMERLFGRSGLGKRDKWTGRGDYRRMLITKANSDTKPSANGQPSNDPQPDQTQATPGNRVGPGAINERVPITVTPDEKRVNDLIIAELARHPQVFQRGGDLVTITRECRPQGKQKINCPEGTPRIRILEPENVREMATEVIQFRQWKKVPHQNKSVLASCRPPATSAGQIVARHQWPPTVRPLEGILEAPCLLPDGRVLAQPGYDPESGLHYLPAIDFPPLNRRASKDDAVAAAKRLLWLVKDFPFLAKSDKAIWLASVLTATSRHAFCGPAPMFVFDANTPGSGKGLLCDVTALVATGREMARVAWPESDEEIRKIITAVALAAYRFILFDNIGHFSTLGGPSLDAALTAYIWQGRILGTTKMSGELPLATLFFGTGNHISFTPGCDTPRRVLKSTLRSRLENPEERNDFEVKNLSAHVKAHRAELLADAVTIMIAFDRAGRPQQPGMTAFGSFDEWNTCIRAAVLWATEEDPLEGKNLLNKQAMESEAISGLIEGWAELDEGTGKGVTVADAFVALRNQANRYSKLRTALVSLSRKGNEFPTTRELGDFIKKYRDRNIGGRCFAEAGKRHGAVAWRIESVS